MGWHPGGLAALAPIACTSTNTLRIPASADSGSPYANVGSGRGILRFDLAASPSVLAGLENGTVKSMTLTLARNSDCDGDVGACNGAPPTTGTFEAYPLRNDWTEGTSTAYSGADWCWRSARPASGGQGDQWQTPGAEGTTDRGAQAAVVTIAAGTTTAAFDLARERHPRAPGARGRRLSVTARLGRVYFVAFTT